MPSSSRKLVSFVGRAWFPAALLVLLILALPGLVLFVLNLFGSQGTVNDWLEDTFQITYHLALPFWLALLLVLVLPAIILLYFLKLKRKPLQVPSTFLWRKSIEDLHVNSLFQWLRQNLLLLLQLLVVLALLYALLGFRFHGSVVHGKHYILMIDNSASMAATDVASSRLEWAKQEALKEIDAAGDDDFGMVLVFNSKASTLQGYTSNRALLREAVKSIRQTHRPTRIEEALALADSLANPVRSTEDVASRPEDEEAGKERTYVQPRGIPTELHVFSDGRFPDLSEAALNNLSSRRAGNVSALGKLSLVLHSAGRPGPEQVNNVGIVGLSAVRLAGGAGRNDPPDRFRLQVLVRVQNFRPQEARVQLHLDVLAAGRIVHPERRDLVIKPRVVGPAKDDPEKGFTDEPGEAQADISLPPLDLRVDTVLHAHLEGNQDDFPLDDEAWLAVGLARKSHVLVIGPANPILDAFFEQEATRKVARIERLAATELGTEKYRKAVEGGDYDLVLFDRCAPEEEKDLPRANTFFIGLPPPPWERGVRQLKYPILMVSKREHPLLRQLTTLWDVGVSEAFRFHPYDNLAEGVRDQYRRQPSDQGKKPLPVLTRLIEAAGNVPVLFTLPRGPYQDLVMTFPLLNDKGDLMTNWPLQPSFPLFMRNVLYVLGGVADAARGESVQPGEPVVLRPESGVRRLVVFPPKGSPQTLERDSRPELVFDETEEPGPFRVEGKDADGKTVTRSGFAVSLLDPQESNIEPRTDFAIGSDRITAGGQRAQASELWKWLVLLALALLLIEWYIYNRRVSI
jgi:hypothetical protein